MHGSPYCNKVNQVKGVYIISMSDNITYVGQSLRLSTRIKEHLLFKVESTKEELQKLVDTSDGSVQTVIVTKDLQNELINNHDITVASFLDLLEQYIIFHTIPTLNKLYVVRRGGNLNPGRINPLAHPLYIYKIVEGSPDTLVYSFSSIAGAGLLVGKSNRFFNKILKGGGILRNTLYCTTTILPNVDSDIITEQSFFGYFQEVIKIPHLATPKSIYVIDVTTNERTGPFKSARFISENVIKGANKDAIKPNRKTPYKGLYIFEYV